MFVRDAITVVLWGGTHHRREITIRAGVYPSNLIRVPAQGRPAAYWRPPKAPDDQPILVSTYAIKLKPDGSPIMRDGKGEASFEG